MHTEQRPLKPSFWPQITAELIFSELDFVGKVISNKCGSSGIGLEEIRVLSFPYQIYFD